MTDVIDALLAALGPDRVRTGEAVPERNRADWSVLPPVRPLALLLPRSVEEVATAVTICRAAGQPIAVQGGLTGLAGGGTPGADEIALSLERLTGVEEIDTAGATITALAGTPLEIVQAAAEAAGFSLGVDLGARGSCQIGGNVATNAGGVQVLRYGMTRANVRGLEVVLADGTIVRSLEGMLKNNAGYDWTQMFVGSEGTLGIVTRVVLALHPPRLDVRTAFCTVPDFAAALRVLRRLQARLAGELTAFEAMWPDYVGYVRDVCGRHCPFDPGAEVALIIEYARGVPAEGDEVTPFETALMALNEEGVLSDAVIAKSGEERRKIWAVREAPAEFPSRMPGLIAFDVSIPLDVFEAAVDDLRAELAARFPGMLTMFYGHVADSNLHLIAWLPGAAEQPKAEVEALVYGVVARSAGSVSAEHGIGRVKRKYLPLTRSEAELHLMRLVKGALDPAGILNPGRIL